MARSDHARSFWRGVRDCYSTKPLLLIAFLLSGGFFFRSGSSFEQHPLAMGGTRELHIAICLLCTGVAVIHAMRKGFMYAGDFLILCAVFLFVFGAAILAHLHFGQPILWGLFEERRTFAVFGVFFIMLCYRYSDATPSQILGALYLTVLIYVVIGLIMQSGIIVDLAARDIPDLDPRKHRILVGTEAYSVSVVMAATMAIRFRAWQHLAPILVGIVGLILISQTRSTISVVIATMGVIFFLRFPITSAGLGSIAGAALLLWLSSGPASVEIAQAGDVQVRVNTANTILTELQANGWFGLGSLSLQWERGFAPFYGKHFFLGDVGILGEFYRLGVLLFIVFIILAGAAVICLNDCPDEKARAAGYSLLVYSLLNSLGGGLIAFAGFEWAVFFSLLAAFREAMASEAAKFPAAGDLYPVHQVRESLESVADYSAT